MVNVTREIKEVFLVSNYGIRRKENLIKSRGNRMKAARIRVRKEVKWAEFFMDRGKVHEKETSSETDSIYGTLENEERKRRKRMDRSKIVAEKGSLFPTRRE